MNVWLLIAGCVVATVLIKAAGPVCSAAASSLRSSSASSPAWPRPCWPPWSSPRRSRRGKSFHVGAETVGMLAGGLLLWRGKSVVLAVLVAMVVTAALRADPLSRNRPGSRAGLVCAPVSGAHSSAVERLPYKQVVAGSIPAAPTDVVLPGAPAVDTP